MCRVWAGPKRRRSAPRERHAEHAASAWCCAAKSHLAARPELPPARKTSLRSNSAAAAAVLVIRDIAPSNEYRLGQRHEPGDLAANRRDSSLRDVFLSSRRPGSATPPRYATTHKRKMR
jgi:hypothetical protein